MHLVCTICGYIEPMPQQAERCEKCYSKNVWIRSGEEDQTQLLTNLHTQYKHLGHILRKNGYTRSGSNPA